MSGWAELFDKASSKNYYFNADTNEVSWDKPAEFGASQQQSSLPPGWSEVFDESTQNYYYINDASGDTTWDKPEFDTAVVAATPAAASPTSDWIEVTDESGAVYYFNSVTNETSWEKPVVSSSPSAVSPSQSEWIEQQDPSSNMTYYINTVTGATQWENPFVPTSPQDNRDRLDSATSALSITDTFMDDESTSELQQQQQQQDRDRENSSPAQRWSGAGGVGLLQRSLGLGGTGPGAGSGSGTSTPRRGSDSPQVRGESITTSTTSAAKATATASATAASRPDKNMTLFANPDHLTLPVFADSGPESAFKSLNNKGKPSPKRVKGADYTAAPSEFMSEYFAASSSSPVGIKSARRRSSSATTMGAMAAAAMASASAASADGGGEAGSPPQLVSRADGEEEDDVDLTAEEAAALDTLDLIEISTPAARAAEILLSVNAQALQSPYVLSHMSEKLTPFGLDKYAEAHFQYDRRANSSGSASHAHPVEKLLAYQADLLKSPLTALSTAAMSTDAVACFRLICAFMDNAKGSGLQQIDLAVNLLLKLLTAPGELHDEIYCQICKQTRKNPSAEGLEFGWQLMLLCLSTIPPSKRLLPYLCNYISTSLHRLETTTGINKSASAPTSTPTVATTGATPGSGGPVVAAVVGASVPQISAREEAANNSNANVMKFVLLALRAVVPAAGAAVRTEIPTRAEIRALLLGESLEVTVDTMVPTMQRAFAVNSYTTVESLLQMMCDAMQVQEGNRRIFTLYEVSSEEEANKQQQGLLYGGGAHTAAPAVEVELSHQERVLDWVSRCQRAQLSSGNSSTEEREHAHALVVTYKLQFKAKYMYRIADHAGDAVTMELLYAQCLSDVIAARYLHAPADAAVLAAFVLQELCGDYHAGTRSLGELKVKGITLSKLVARSILDPHQPHVINRHEMESRIFAAYKALTGVGREQARRMYLSYISCWKVFGATFFIVSGQVNNNFDEIVLSVSVNSILLLDPVTTEFLAEYTYSDVHSWGHSFDSFVLVIGSKASQSKSYFKTAQGKEIDGLVKLYHEHHVRCSSGGGGGGSSSNTGSVGGSGGEHLHYSGVGGGAGGLALKSAASTQHQTAKGSVSFNAQ